MRKSTRVTDSKIGATPSCDAAADAGRAVAEKAIARVRICCKYPRANDIRKIAPVEAWYEHEAARHYSDEIGKLLHCFKKLIAEAATTPRPTLAGVRKKARLAWLITGEVMPSLLEDRSAPRDGRAGLCSRLPLLARAHAGRC